MHGCFILKESTSIGFYLNDLEKFALVFSGLCHDVAHRGFTNNFEILSYSKLAVRYHDKSVKKNKRKFFNPILGFRTTSRSYCLFDHEKRKKQLFG